EEQLAAAEKWATQLAELAESGIDEGILRQLAEAGPQAQPLIEALLSEIAAGNLGIINDAQAKLDDLLSGTIQMITAHVAPSIVAGTQIGEGIAEGIVTGIANGSRAVQEAMAQAVREA